MRAIALREPGCRLAELDLPVPAIDERELLVRVQASSINPIDVRVATGRYPWGEYDYPVVPGFDFAGTVEAVGSGVRRFAAGDDVLGYWSAPRFGSGAWAELVAVAEAGFVAARPAAVPVVDAAALPLAAATALLAIDAAAPRAGDVVLIVGAGGAIGGYAVQLAAAAGATVIATAKPGDEGRLCDLGAAKTIDYTREDVLARVREPGAVAALIDLANESRLEVTRIARLVGDGGRVVSACFAADRKTLAAHGIAATNVVASACDPSVVTRVVELVERGALRVGYDDVQQLSAGPAAVDELARGPSAKVVVDVAG